ncbi:hypothetical protein N7517_000003 [Penicillium concentricum]|uniref:glucan 1,3-beta-glucosidase n=1 Tax=Penicillium concentricum TaxID=293559 RepID=A0A9W9VHH0_9EURO|nr:uncharacterized protein N7517_000003 [Penicillium concentricum]KAJ5382092.1 hypothetical protein N7517_000003 [Penicillium concentricum]
MLWKTVYLVSLFVSRAWGKPNRQVENSDYVNWQTFKANGVNLGGWLIQEPNIDPTWWNTYSGGAADEWDLCRNLGSQCGPVLEKRYATWITTLDIDKAARSGVTLLRIPTTYSAWIQFPGSHLYSGNQTSYLNDIATYAIEKHGMHIIIDVHALPGGVNGLTIGEAVGHWDWFFNQTHFDYSMRVIDAVISFIQNSGHPESYTLEPLNEPADNHNLSVFGTPAALSDEGAEWVLRYIHAVLDRVASVNGQIPVMFQGSFKNEKYWSGNFTGNENLVFDVHNYYFAGRNTTSLNLPSFLRSDAKTMTGDGKFPVFVGEWSIQAFQKNSYSRRAQNVNFGLETFHNYGQGSSYWTWKFTGNETVDGQGAQRDYWNYEHFVDNGYFQTCSN